MISKRFLKDLRCNKKWSVVEISLMSSKSFFWDIFKGPGFESQWGQTEKKTEKFFYSTTSNPPLYLNFSPCTHQRLWSRQDSNPPPSVYWSDSSTTAPLFHVKYEWLNDAFITSFVLLMCFNSFIARAGIIFEIK